MSARSVVAARPIDRATPEIARSSSAGPWRRAFRALRANRPAWWCALFLAAVVLVSLAAPLLPLPSPVTLALQDEPLAPTPPWVELGTHGFRPEYWDLGAIDRALVEVRQAVFGDWQTAHWLGTDAQGRDLLSRIVWGSRTSLGVGLMALLTSLVLGVGVGAIAGLAGGKVDEILMRIVDALYSLPFIFVVIFLITLLDAWRAELARFGLDRESLLYVTIGLFYWLTMARVVRGQVLSLRRAAFLEAARLAGASPLRVTITHAVPNVLSVIVVYLTLSIPSILLFESFLSFLGLGVAAPRVSFGLLAADGVDAISPLRIDWWLVLGPSLAMGSVLFSLNVLGDGLRDALDPRDGKRR